jgi:iron(III) transport system substrate-binding protein
VRTQPATPQSAAAGGSAGPLEPLIQRAAAEGELTIISSAGVWRGTEGMQAIQDAFNAKYKMNVKFNWAPGASMIESAIRVAQEVRANQPATTDVVVTVAEGVNQLQELAAPIPFEAFVDAPAGAAASNNRAVRVMSDFFGITYNTKLVSAEQAPRKLDDLLDPRWKGKIAGMSTGSTYAYLPFLIGPDKARAFVKQFAQQVSALTRCGEEERVASGEFLIFAINCGSYGPAQVAAKGAPLAGNPLDDGAIMLHWYLLVPKTSAHPALATMFSAFMATKEGQEVSSRVAFVADYLVDGMPMQKVRGGLVAKGANILDITPEWYAANSAEAAKYADEFTKLLKSGQSGA